MAGFPEEGHDGCKVRGEGKEGLQGFVSEDRPKGIFDVSGYEHVALAGRG